MTHALDLPARLFLGRVIDKHHNRRALRDPPRRTANDPRPQLPPRLVQCSAEKCVIAREVLHARGPGQPEIGGDRLALPTSHAQPYTSTVKVCSEGIVKS